MKVTILLKSAETVNAILMDCASASSASTATSSKQLQQGRGSRLTLDCGAPGEWVRIREVAERRRQKESEERQKRLE